MKPQQLFLFFLLITGAITASGQAGTLDKTFSSDGKLTTLVSSTKVAGNSVVIQTDGKILVAGNFKRTGSDPFNVNDFAVVRYNMDGTLDGSFGGGNGKVGIDFGTDEGPNPTIALLQDGKIIVAGYTAQDNDIEREYIAIARLNVDGSPDLGFGSVGQTKIKIEGFYGSMAIQPDGKIVVGGYTLGSPFVLYRLNSNGTIDNSFGNNGEVMHYFGFFSEGPNDGVHAILIQPDGKVVSAGTVSTNSRENVALTRHNSNGTIDASFGSNGQVVTSIGSTGNAGGNAAVLQSDNKILVAGYYTPSDRSFAAVRYNQNGTLDNSFAGNGKVGIDFTYGSQANALVLQKDGKIVLAGKAINHTGADFALVRLTGTGGIDNGFGTAGKVTTDFGSTDVANGMALQFDGKIVVAGSSGNFIAAARYSSGAVIAIAAPTPVSKTNHNSVYLYPNPAVTTIRVQGLNPFSATNLSITDVTGRILKKDISAGADNYLLNIGHLIPGVYSLQVEENHQTQSLKFIKK